MEFTALELLLGGGFISMVTAIVALREAALAWATVKEKPGSWPEAFDAAVRAVASASEAIDTIRKEAAS